MRDYLINESHSNDSARRRSDNTHQSSARGLTLSSSPPVLPPDSDSVDNSLFILILFSIIEQIFTFSYVYCWKHISGVRRYSEAIRSQGEKQIAEVRRTSEPPRYRLLLMFENFDKF